MEDKEKLKEEPKSDGSCPFCKDKEISESCPFCQENASAESDVLDENCPFCKEGEDCPLCKENGAAPIGSPDSTDEEAPAGSEEEKAQYEEMGMNPPVIGKPLPPGEEPLIGQNAPMESTIDDPLVTNATTAPTPDPEDSSSKEALTSIAQQIESEGTPPASETEAIDDADLPSGDNSEGNISRPEGFGQTIPGDMGLGGPNGPEDDDSEPEFSEILEEGLNHNADSISREKTIRMVSQALMQFKGCKQILESTKLQSPQLYQASISMLRAMIGMAEMMGLGQSGDALGQNGGELGQIQESLLPPEEQNDEWNNPFPAHPDHGGEAKPSHSKSPSNPDNAEGTIGQPVGKLSSKHTTEHVARTTMPPGAINEKGQQKIIDDQGNTRWIDRKKGMVQGPSGAPVKPPKRGE